MPNKTPLFFFALLFFIVGPACLTGQQTPPSSTSKSTPPTGAQAEPKSAPGQPAPESKPPAQASKEDPVVAAWKLLGSGADSDKLRSRSDALSALTVLDSDPRAVSLIEARLEDKEETIRVVAATSLGDIKARSAIPELKKHLDDSSAQVSFAAAQALWKMGDRSGREIFYEVLDGERKTHPGLIKSKVITAKQEMHDPKALALIGINEASGAFLGPFSMGVSMVEEYARNTTAPVQSVCAQLLAMDDSRSTTDELEDALWDKNWAVRAAAARALAKMNDRKAAKHLADIVANDKQESARFVAAAAFIRLSGKPRTRVAPRSTPPVATPETQPKSDVTKPL